MFNWNMILVGMLWMTYFVGICALLIAPLIKEWVGLSPSSSYHREWSIRVTGAVALVYLLFDWVVYACVVMSGMPVSRYAVMLLGGMDGLLLPFYHFLTTAIIKRRPLSFRLIFCHLFPFVVLEVALVFLKNDSLMAVEYGAYLIYLIVIVVLDMIQVVRFCRRFKNTYSATTGQWRIFTRGIPAIEFCMLMLASSIFVFDGVWGGTLCLVSSIVLALLLLGFLLAVLNEYEHMNQAEEMAVTTLVSASNSDEEQVSLLDPTEKYDFLTLLQQVCVDTELYCSPNLSRDELVVAMGTNTTYFSQRLKAATGHSFYDYINNLRLDRAALLLRDCPDMTIDDIQHRVGFTHASTFHRLFKSHFGCTPLAMRKKLALAPR